MGTFSRQSWPVFVVAAVAIAVCCRSFPGRHIRRPSDPIIDIDVGSEEHRAQLRFLKWSAAERVRIARGVIGGDLTLWEAAACYHQLDAQRPPGLEATTIPQHGERSEEERLCRHVIRYVRIELILGGQDVTIVLELEARLEDELRLGDVLLPAPPPGVVEPYDSDRR
jgi:hypothetical protein